MRQEKIELFMFSMRMSAVDKKLIDSLCSSFEINSSEIMKCALYEFAASQNSKLFKDSLKELARLKQTEFKMEVMKEIEHITHRQAYYLDGFMNTLKDYYSKYVPIDIVRRYVTVKIISLYTLFETGQRKEFTLYLKKHFLHFYPNEKQWINTQFRLIRSMKKNEKDELLAKLSGRMPQMQEMGRALPKQFLPELPASRIQNTNNKATGKKKDGN